MHWGPIKPLDQQQKQPRTQMRAEGIGGIGHAKRGEWDTVEQARVDAHA